ncbi:MAG: hypothetical protein J6328_00445 [Bacilli bacterium]|nr:hypothetical protein [Bacilli bacterium]
MPSCSGKESKPSSLAISSINWEQRFSQRHVSGELIVTLAKDPSGKIISKEISEDEFFSNLQIDSLSFSCLSPSCFESDQTDSEIETNLVYLLTIPGCSDSDLIQIAKTLSASPDFVSVDLNYEHRSDYEPISEL